VTTESPTSTAPSGRAPRVSSRATRRRLAILGGQVLIIACIFAVWQGLSGNPQNGSAVNEFLFGRPSDVWQRFVEGLQDGSLLDAIRVTLEEAVIGLAIGAGGGIILAFALSLTWFGRRVIAPMVFALYAVPRLVLAPYFIFAFGLGLWSKVALVVAMTFFYAFMSTFQGALAVDTELLAVARMMQAKPLQLVRTINLPSAMIWVALSLKQATPNAFQAAIVAELLASNSGLGLVMTSSQDRFDVNGVLVGTLVTTVLAILVYAIVQLATRPLLRWRSSPDADR
jgi:NitT/TauT family transport system permease protein